MEWGMGRDLEKKIRGFYSGNIFVQFS